MMEFKEIYIYCNVTCWQTQLQSKPLHLTCSTILKAKYSTSIFQVEKEVNHDQIRLSTKRSTQMQTRYWLQISSRPLKTLALIGTDNKYRGINAWGLTLVISWRPEQFAIHGFQQKYLLTVLKWSLPSYAQLIFLLWSSVVIGISILLLLYTIGERRGTKELLKRKLSN